MGVTIAYRGRLADLTRIEDFEDRLLDDILVRRLSRTLGRLEQDIFHEIGRLRAQHRAGDS
jgi:hypothetical protein